MISGKEDEQGPFTGDIWKSNTNYINFVRHITYVVLHSSAIRALENSVVHLLNYYKAFSEPVRATGHSSPKLFRLGNSLGGGVTWRLSLRNREPFTPARPGREDSPGLDVLNDSP